MLATIGCDRVTKHFAAATLAEAPTRSFMADTIRLQYMENTGAFLNLGSDWPVEIRTVVFSGGSAVLLLAAAIITFRSRRSGSAAAGLALFVAGGASNLVDRVAQGRVVDFMNVGIGPVRTGIFNVADMAIMAGVVTWLFATVRSGERVADGPGRRDNAP
jgi:signal peptidase II